MLKENGFRWEPAVYLQAFNAAIAVLVAFNVLSGVTANAATVAVAGAVALATAVLTRPWVVSAFTGAVQTLLSAVVMFGLPLTEQQSGAVLALVAVVLGLVLRSNVTPVTKAQAGLAA